MPHPRWKSGTPAYSTEGVHTKYLQSDAFAIPKPSKVMAGTCEACVWGEGEHAEGCANRTLACKTCGSVCIIAKAYSDFYCADHIPHDFPLGHGVTMDGIPFTDWGGEKRRLRILENRKP